MPDQKGQRKRNVTKPYRTAADRIQKLEELLFQLAQRIAMLEKQGKERDERLRIWKRERSLQHSRTNDEERRGSG